MSQSKKKPGCISLVFAVILIGIVVFLFQACTGSDGDDDVVPADTSENATTSHGVTVTDMSADGDLFVSAEYPVPDSIDKDDIVTNLKEGCVNAIQAAKKQTPDWARYDTIQCMGMSDWSDESVFVGSANFTGPQLAEISDDEMTDSPESFWDQAVESNISPQL